MKLMKEEMQTVVTRKAQGKYLIDEGKAMVARLVAAGIGYSLADIVGGNNLEVVGALGAYALSSPLIDLWGERKEKRIKNKYENMMERLDHKTEIQKGKIYAQATLLIAGSVEWHFKDAVKRVSPAG